MSLLRLLVVAFATAAFCHSSQGGEQEDMTAALKTLEEVGCGEFPAGTETVAAAWVGVDWQDLDVAEVDTARGLLEDDVRRHKAMACAVARIQSVPLGYPLDEDEGEPYLWAAEAGLEIGGCQPRAVDGLVDEDTVAAWNRAANALELPPWSTTRTPSQVVDLLAGIAPDICRQPEARESFDLATLIESLGRRFCDDRRPSDALGLVRDQLANTDQRERALKIFWSRWCAPRYGLGSTLAELLQLSVDNPFQDALDDARLLYGAALLSFDEPAATLGRKLVASVSSPEAIALQASASASGIHLDAPTSPIAPGAGYDAAGTAYLAYAGALDGTLSRSDAARIYVDFVNWVVQDIDDFNQQEGQSLPPGAGTSMWVVTHLIRLAELITGHPDVAEAVIREASDKVLLYLGDVILEGHSAAGRDAHLGYALIRRAADSGLAAAKYRMGIAYAFGGIGNPDLAKGRALLQEAAEIGYPKAIVLLATLAEDRIGDPAGSFEARDWYQRLFAQANPYALIDLLKPRIMAGSPYLNSEAGRTALLHLVADNNYVAVDLADTYSCFDCGTNIDLDLAAWWLRKAAASGGSENGATSALLGLLIRQPQLRQSDQEPDNLIESLSQDERPLFAILKDPENSQPREVSVALDQLCRADEGGTNCLTVAHDIAVGRYSSKLAPTGVEALRELHQHPIGDPELSGAGWALMDVLAYYGEWDEALQLIDATGTESYGFDGPRMRNLTFRRLISQLRAHPESVEAVGLKKVLTRLAEVGDEDAEAFLSLMVGAGGSAGVSVRRDTPLAELVSDYNGLTQRGGMSLGLASSAHALALAYNANGETATALQYELIALQVRRQLDAAIAASVGPLEGALADACAMSRASESAEKFGYPIVAIALAKAAVNRLQAVRRELKRLHHNLQVCFTNVVSDSYRTLADLLVRNHRVEDAQRVLDALRDFETFAYFEQEPDLTGAALSSVELSATEQSVLNLVDSIDPPITRLALRKRVLDAMEPNLTAAERAESASIEAQIADQAIRIGAITQQITSSNEDEADVLQAQIFSVTGRLQREFNGDAVVLYFAVLNDRMHGILATPTVVVPHTWSALGGKPFTEQALNAKVAAFRGKLQTPASDPKPLARELFDLLLKPFWSEIVASGATKIYLSLDGQLRNLPFAALRPGAGYLAQSYEVALLSTRGDPEPDTSRPLSRVTAAGVTDPPLGFDELPAAGWEIDGLVDDASGFGLLPGAALADDAFTLEALQAEVNKEDGAPGALLHIASHFVLRSSDSASFLLLGQNDRLTNKKLKDAVKGRLLQLEHIDMVTLSACETAVGENGDNGKPLQSLASFIQRYGARTVLATLWSVADKATALFMLRFYELSIRNGMASEAALSTTMREFVEGHIGGDAASESIVANLAKKASIELSLGSADYRFAHPYYWAPFVLYEGR